MLREVLIHQNFTSVSVKGASYYPTLSPDSKCAHFLFLRDGAPYCERDYQIHFGVQCEACHQFITGKVLEVSDLPVSVLQASKH